MVLLEVVFNVTIEFPDVNAISLADTDDLLVVARVEHDAVDGIGVSDETLEIVRDSFLGFIVPDLYHAILSSSQQIS